eukprot:TRINITY_DN4157_c0_g1_i1.p1 TRINITY_DN4157_c0_g1~~TRINITY_DN4157_c0_g1_i1.p1  ORF type:complete len:1410 (-),score=334.03 TRINITY_DN4157_c0_g1_i1:2-3844(-)
MRTQIDFLRKGYSPGQTVEATLEVSRSEGGYPVGADVSSVVRIDGKETFRGSSVVDAEGRCRIQFVLPDYIEKGVGSLSLTINDGGVVQNASKTIPILLRAIDVNVYPEGGDLVAGVKNKIYIEAFTPTGDPADIVADICHITDYGMNVVGNIETVHEGRGSSTFTPEKSGRYELYITNPTGVVVPVPIPEVKEVGAIISSCQETYKAGDVALFTLNASGLSGETLKVIIRRYDYVLFETDIAVDQEFFSEDITFDISSGWSGVMTITIEDKKRPYAERLFFIEPHQYLNIDMKTDKTVYSPGEKVDISLNITDETGKGIADVFLPVTVTDDAVLQMVDRRLQMPRLASMNYLEHEVNELYDSSTYFFSLDPELESKSIDLLLGTQGWRRFVLYSKTDMDETKRNDILAISAIEESFSISSSISDESDFEEFDDFDPPLMFLKQEIAAVDNAMKMKLAPMEDMAIEMQVDARDIEMEIAPVEDLALNEALDIGMKMKLAPMEDMALELELDAFGDAADIIVPQKEKKRKIMARKASQKKKIPQNRGRRRIPSSNSSEEEFIFSKLVPRNAYIRKYSHSPILERSGIRKDFVETVYWKDCLITDKDGSCSFSFYLNDSITSFRCMVDGLSLDGRFGQKDINIESIQPFYIEPKLPIEVSCGDKCDIPLSIISSLNEHLTVNLRTSAGTSRSVVLQKPEMDTSLNPTERKRVLVPMIVESGNEIVSIQFSANTNNGQSDHVVRETKVAPIGFPYYLSSSGVVSVENQVDWRITIPQNVDPNSASIFFKVYSSATSNLTSSLKALIREPSGCFEQTSSTVYPMIMAMQYFQANDGPDKESLMKKAGPHLESGYKRLVGYECKKGGYDWFGSDPASEVLTAYGIMEFTELKEVRPDLVDENMLKRTISWLLSRRDGNGSFEVNTRFLHIWKVDPSFVTVYCCYALTSAGLKDELDKEIDWIAENCMDMKDSYLQALLANTFLNIGEFDLAVSICNELIEKQTDKGFISGAHTSMTCSKGKALKIETTAFALMAMIKLGERFRVPIEKAIQFIFSSASFGGYGNTQSTILSLKAIMAYDQSKSSSNAPSDISFKVNDKECVRSTIKPGETKDTDYELNELVLNPGDHNFSLTLSGESELTYELGVLYYDVLPDNSDDCSVELHTSLSNDEIPEGEVSEIHVEVHNVTDDVLPMTLAIVGIPGGLEPRHDQLKELVKKGTVAYYEILGRDLVFYFRSMEPREQISFDCEVVAVIPGEYEGPASRTYLYYTNEHKHWNPASLSSQVL